MRNSSFLLWPLCLLSKAYAVTSLNAVRSQLPAPPIYDEAVGNGTFGYYPLRTYASEDGLTSPQTNWLQWDSQCDDGLFYFIAPRGLSLPNPGPMILDRHGNLVWTHHFDNDFGGTAYNLQVQRYQGADYLTFWLGDDEVKGHGSGYNYMLNSSYDVVHTVGAANERGADLHEFLITPEGTALMTIYDIIEFDVTHLPGYEPSEEPGPTYIWDCLFQEVDIETGNLVFEWSAAEHIDISESYQDVEARGPYDDPFDWFHINSVDKDHLGNYLISARFTHSITYIDGKTGDIIWTLGGARNSFMDLSDGFAINFAWQHDARFLSADTFSSIYSPPRARKGYRTKLISLFDNAAENQHYDYGVESARGLLLELTYPIQGTAPSRNDPSRGRGSGDPEDMNGAKVSAINGTNSAYSVRVIRTYESPERLPSSSQGSLQVLNPTNGRDPKVFIGYGVNAIWTEFKADGSVLCDAHFGADISWESGDVQSYRSFKFPWVGHPQMPPALELVDDDESEDEIVVYVSWNGATEVATWVLQCSVEAAEDQRSWADVAQVAKTDFETGILVPEEFQYARFMRAIALGADGRPLPFGISATLDRGMMLSYTAFLPGSLSPWMETLSALNLSLIFLCAFAGTFALLTLYRRLLSWMSGKPSVGPWRWRGDAVAYRPLPGA